MDLRRFSSGQLRVDDFIGLELKQLEDKVEGEGDELEERKGPVPGRPLVHQVPTEKQQKKLRHFCKKFVKLPLVVENQSETDSWNMVSLANNCEGSMQDLDKKIPRIKEPDRIVSEQPDFKPAVSAHEN